MQNNNQELIKLGKYLYNLRKNKNLSLSSVAYKSGIDPSTLSRIEKGQIEPKFLTLKKLFKTLDVDLAKIF